MKKSERENFVDDIIDFESWTQNSCNCHTGNPPCGWCTHEGNPQNYLEDEDAKMTKEALDKLADTEFLPGDLVYTEDQIESLACDVYSRDALEVKSLIVNMVGVDIGGIERVQIVTNGNASTYDADTLTHAENAKVNVIEAITKHLVVIANRKF